MSTEPADLRETPTLIVTVLRQLTQLLQNEIALARKELSVSLSRAGAGLAMIALAGIVALVALNVLAAALVAWLATAGLGAGLAATIVGGALLIVALVLVLVGKSRLSAEALTPERTVRNIRTDVTAVKEATNV